MTFDFDWMYLVGRTRFMLDQATLERMRMGKWSAIYHAYREQYNFETKQMIFKDIEEETKIRQMERQPVVSVLDL